MNDPIDAALTLGEFLTQHGIEYVVIGGLAVQIWGEARFTKDADMTISSSIEHGVEPVVDLITQTFQSRVPDPFEFAKRSRMILIETKSGVDVDISLALPGYEDDLFSRAVSVDVQPGKRISVCSPEDLIIHKAIAGRPQDLSDIESVIVRQGGDLKHRYIRNWLARFAEMLEDDRIQDRFENAWKKHIDKAP